MAKEIPLTKGKVAIVDDADYTELSLHRWYYVPTGPNGYAAASINRQRVLMHRYLMKPKTWEEHVDHKNNNGLDNRRSNLRLCTAVGNMRNRGPRKGRKFKGVRQVNGKWTACVSLSGTRKINLGHFATEVEAARAYNEAAKKYHGEFAWLNPVAEKA